MNIFSHKRLKLAFLWHMHQPYYKDDLSGTIMMPWVFLHAIKDYYELLWHIERFEKIKATFNLVPSLMVQIEAYKDVDVEDRFLMLWREAPKSVTAQDRSYLLKSLFHAKYETMIRPLERYRELYLQKERMGFERFLDEILDDEIIDLEVLYILAWCGEYLREHNEVVAALIEKGRGFDANDKSRLLATLCEFVGTIVEKYRTLQECGKIEISTTPFYHPILPLLIDMENGIYSNKALQIPRFTREFYGDARVQIERAIAFYQESFGCHPRGFWPSEGSVSNETLEILAENGVRWCASDEDVLFKTIGSRERANIHHRYRLRSYGREIDVYFRDKSLSDRVGFNYSGVDAKKASEDFIATLQAIYEASDGDVVVPVILDGENAWEYYEKNGRWFFEELYGAISESAWIDCVRFEDLEYLDPRILENLEPGSWINGDFGIWLGEPEENSAWRALKKARDALEESRERIDASSYEKAFEELLIAQGSDWYWWYGGDHFTPIKDEYDALFRKHLRNIYEIIGEEIPMTLYEPIFCDRRRLEKPTSALSDLEVIVDGKESYFFEWSNSGRIESKERFSTMSSSDRYFDRVYYGKDEDAIYLKIIGQRDSDGILEIELGGDEEKERVRIDLQKSSNYLKRDTFVELAFRDENRDKELMLSMRLLEDGIAVEQIATTAIELDFDYKKNWFI